MIRIFAVLILILTVSNAAHAASTTSYVTCADPFAESTDRQQTDLFIGEVRNKVNAYMHFSAFQAEYLHACTRLLEQNDDRWFKLYRASDIENERASCENQLRSYQEAIVVRWKPMRIALALSQPKLREDRLTDQIETKLDRNPQHSVLRLAKMPPLTRGELSRAIDQYDAEVARLRAEFAAEAKKKRWWHTEGAESRYVLRGMDAFRKEQRKEYARYMNEMPLIGFLSSARIDYEELGRAFLRVHDNADELLKKGQEGGPQKAEFFADFEPVINEVLEGKPEYCAVAHGWIRALEKSQKIASVARFAINVAGSVGSVYAPTLWLRLTSLGINAATTGHYIYTTYKSYSDRYSRTFSSLLDEAGISDFDALSKEQRQMILATVFISTNFAAFKVPAAIANQ